MLLLAPLQAVASNFVVSPTEIDLSTSTTSALMTLRNVSKAPLRFEVTFFTWSEDEHGVMALQPSTDVTFFPKLIELAPGTSRNLSSSYSDRTMAGPSFETLHYNVYLDATHRTIWGDGTNGTEFYFDAHPPNGRPVTVPSSDVWIPGRRCQAENTSTS